jgi:hypothetical protein
VNCLFSTYLDFTIFADIFEFPIEFYQIKEKKLYIKTKLCISEYITILYCAKRLFLLTWFNRVNKIYTIGKISIAVDKEN